MTNYKILTSVPHCGVSVYVGSSFIGVSSTIVLFLPIKISLERDQFQAQLNVGVIASRLILLCFVLCLY